MNLPIYLDNHATTPVDQRVIDEMLPYFTEVYGNSASIDHEYGYQALRAVNKAREQVCKAIGAKSPSEIIFTSGATESDNLALIGVAERYIEKGKHIITCVTEHKAILDTCNYLQQKGWEVTCLKVDSYGMIDIEEIRSAIKTDTILISIMAANNEIGTIAPLEEIGKIAREHNILFHTDAAQAAGHIPIDVQKLNIDLLSMSGHKVYGPKGIGALYVRNSRPRVKISEQVHGGGHERGMRSGTLNVPGIVGLGKALEICNSELASHQKKQAELRDFLWESIEADVNGVQINGHPTKRLPHNLSVYIPGIETKSLIVQLKNHIAISTGSACTTATVEPSHVILALGFGKQRAYSSVRFGLGRFTTVNEIKYAAEIFIKTVVRLQQFS
jgi:cysteine desulfurase